MVFTSSRVTSFLEGLFRNRELFDEGAYVMPVVRLKRFVVTGRSRIFI